MIEIPARRGKAIRVKAGQRVRVINTHGQQVVDTWAFLASDQREFMSMEHSRVAIGRIIPAVGDALVTNRRRPIMTLLEDTSGGIHDTLFAACDRWRYETLGCRDYHDNCTDNLAAALAEIGLEPPETPAPLNLFMNIPVIDGNRVEIRPPVSTARQLCDIARRARLRPRLLRLSAGHRADQRAGAAPDRGACRGARLGYSGRNFLPRPISRSCGRCTDLPASATTWPITEACRPWRFRIASAASTSRSGERSRRSRSPY